MLIKLVVFDLDDTLYNETDYCRSGFSAVAVFLSKTYPFIDKNRFFGEFWSKFVSENRQNIFNSTLDDLNITYDNSLITKLLEVYRNHKPDIKLPEDSRKTLQNLAKTHILALLTDGYLPAQKLKVQALGIENYFSQIVYTEELGRENWKPSPVGFKKICENLNIPPENMVYIGDNIKKDFIAPNSMGATTIRLIRPGQVHKHQPATDQAKPQYTVNKITDIPALLEKICESTS